MDTVDTGDLFPYVIAVTQYAGISDTVVQTASVIMPSGQEVEFFGPDAESMAEAYAKDCKAQDKALLAFRREVMAQKKAAERAQMAVIASSRLALDAVRYEVAAASGVQL